ncbi:conjugal transfer protein traB [Sphingomonas sp. SKA58]|uniref:ATPase, T2SS/T4P/T4SS family n=1 Tax=Sphingomonas sp. (strain SKA58) TaxID=314266 RepID=UPI0000D7B484|nr:ATPase, T2SS/T4P/T4SS family [Sphingomonas sp. SKA58]EAT08447.1 conjugal transfer protein traB [Sphingomonas sp. SKA58]|tara:strand:- start:1138 stop:1995 length:858 start_codon:yes stop_codon:yes gene_type:complete
MASHARTEVHGERPIVSAELPPHGQGAGERFEGILPPVSTAPCFSIRKPAARVYTLMDYVADGIMSAEAARMLSLAVVDRRNILIAGGTSSGKTTLANALLAEMAHLDERVILIEDTRELQSPAHDTVALRTRAGAVTMGDLVRSTLRLRPDRIIVGEVRGGEALDMLKAWNTGHPGGIATVHANSASSALYRIEQLIQEAVVTVPRRLVADLALQALGASGIIICNRRAATACSNSAWVQSHWHSAVRPIPTARSELTAFSRSTARKASPVLSCAPPISPGPLI